MSNLKILYGYPYYKSESTYGDSESYEQEYLERIRNSGIDVEWFCLTINPPNSCLSFKDLDLKWKYRDKKLLRMYEQLEKALEGKDVLINAAGINLHPEFVAGLPVFTVFQCFDDPENSHNLSKPAASAYDLALVGNIAEISNYKEWGVKNVEWTPLGLHPDIYDSSLTYEDILNTNREIDLFMMIDRMSPWRKNRMDKMDEAFPNAHFYGRGWPRGYLANEKQLKYLRNSKIGPNFHNSTGPINFRTFYLPANGVMQICDNRSHLGRIFELNREVVGFDTVEECIELCRYYLEHDDERREIAANGWKRAVSDYNEVAVFKKKIEIIQSYLRRSNGKEKRLDTFEVKYRNPRIRRSILKFITVYRFIGKVSKKIIRVINKYFLRRQNV